jgi:hypothetical protein
MIGRGQRCLPNPLRKRFVGAGEMRPCEVRSLGTGLGTDSAGSPPKLATART